MNRNPKVRLAGMFLAGTLILSACAQDEEAAGPTPRTETQAAGEVSAEVCDANIAINKGFNKVFSEGGPEGEGPPTPEQLKKFQDAMDKEVLPHVATFEANVPEELKEEAKTAVASVRKFRADPANYDFEGDKQAHEAIGAVEEHLFENCDVKKGTVEAVEYEFKDVSADFKAGEDMMVKLDNQGKEVHEFVVLGKKEGVTDSWDDILKLDEEQGRAKTVFLGVAFAAPGKQDYGVFSFPKPGDYIAVCFIPKGTTSEEQLGGPEGGEGPAATGSPGATTSPTTTASPTSTASPSPTGTAGEGGGAPGGEGGPPHFTLGMRKELKVT